MVRYELDVYWSGPGEKKVRQRAVEARGRTRWEATRKRTEGHDVGEQSEGTIQQDMVLGVHAARQELHLQDAATFLGDERWGGGGRVLARAFVAAGRLGVRVRGIGRGRGHGGRGDEG